MPKILIALLVAGFVSNCSATTHDINVVAWNQSQPAFDTIINATSGDTLVYKNAAVNTASYIKFVNGYSTDTITNVLVGDTIDVHPLIFSDTVITYYVWTQMLTYGLRSHINFLDVGISEHRSEINLAMSGAVLHVQSPSTGTLTIIDLNGKVVFEQILEAEEQQAIDLSALTCGVYIVSLKNDVEILAVRKVGIMH